MVDCSELMYQYDGTFEGLMTCVFESYSKKEVPLDILSPANRELMLFSSRVVETDLGISLRVIASVRQRIGGRALEFVQQAFLTCAVKKELYILLFLRLGFKHGPSVINMLSHEVVDKLFKAVTHLKRESQLLKGLVRFSVYNNALAAEIEPKNFVLPLLRDHFCDRYQGERFLIYDKTNGMALVYQPYRSVIIPITDLELPVPDAEELVFRELWRCFYDTTGIKERDNPRCRMSHMPKRYWKYLTEFGQADRSLTSPQEASTKNSTSMKVLGNS